jgi:mono/diheme cytochrome c family protein
MIDTLYRFLASVGFKDPLHAPIVHVPIGLVIGALVFFAVAIIFRRGHLAVTARRVSILALVFVFPSILFGVFDWLHFYHGAMIPAIRFKIGLAAALLVLLGAGVILGGEAKPLKAAMAIIYACSFIAVVALGYFGGSIVYGQGKLVADSPSIGVASPARERAPGDGGNDGRALFESNCRACHPGGGNAIVASLPIKGSGRMASLDAFARFIRAPAMPDGKEGSMPAFGEDELEDLQVRELYAYLEAEFK